MINNTKEKEITVDELAIMVKRSFDHVQEEFTEVSNRFDKLENQIGELHIESVKIQSIEKYGKIMDKKLDIILRNMVSKQDFETVAVRLEKLETAF